MSAAFEPINDFEILVRSSYSDFDGSKQREIALSKALQNLALIKGTEEEQEFFDFDSEGRLHFRGTPIDELATEKWPREILTWCRRVLAQFKIPGGYLLVLDLGTRRNVYRMLGFDIMPGQPMFQIMTVSETFDPICHQAFMGTCLQRRLWSRTKTRRRKTEQFNPLLDHIIVDDKRIDFRLKSRGWLRVKLYDPPSRRLGPFWAIPFQTYPPHAWWLWGHLGPQHFRVRPCFRLRLLNDETILSLLYYIWPNGYLWRAFHPN